jgi:hypothetical protein
MTLAALIAHAFTAFGVLMLAHPLTALAVVSFNAFAIFFVIAVTFAAFIAHVLTLLGVFALFPIPLLDFRDTARHDRGNRWRLKSGRWRRRQCECRQGKSETKTY